MSQLIAILPQGTRGLSLFYLETKDENGGYNNLEIQVSPHPCSCNQQHLAVSVIAFRQHYINTIHPIVHPL